MIKVLIIDDEKIEIRSAMAGLIPLSDNAENEPDVVKRAELARKVFVIETAENIETAMNKIKSFVPDLVIIDILLPNSITIEGAKLSNGIDIYRFLEKHYKKMIKIIFTNYVNAPKHVNRLSEQEERDLIPKAEGAGYEILANRISKYLRQIAIQLISEIDPARKDHYYQTINEQYWEALKVMTFKLESGRELGYQDICLFVSHPIMDDHEAKLLFSNPKEELLKIFNLLTLNSGEQNTFVWSAPPIIDMFLHIKKKKEHYYPKINKDVESFIESYINNIGAEVAVRAKFIDFRLIEHKNKNHPITHPHFKEKMLNALVLRRVLIFFEMFIRKEIDTNELNVTSPNWRIFFHQMPDQIMRSVHLRTIEYTNGDMNQFAASLNLGFQGQNGDYQIGRRQIVNFDDFVVSDFEKKWFHSTKHDELYVSLKKIIQN